MRIVSRRLSLYSPISPAITKGSGSELPAVSTVGHQRTVVWFSTATTTK